VCRIWEGISDTSELSQSLWGPGSSPPWVNQYKLCVSQSSIPSLLLLVDYFNHTHTKHTYSVYTLRIISISIEYWFTIFWKVRNNFKKWSQFKLPLSCDHRIAYSIFHLNTNSKSYDKAPKDKKEIDCNKILHKIKIQTSWRISHRRI
jgi:hypothetical protein